MTTQTFTEANFEAEVLGSDKPVLVDFWAPWCGPCRALAPAVDELATEVGDSAVIGKVNIDENPGLAAQYGVQSIPTVLFFKNGEIADRAIGVLPKADLRAKLGIDATA